MDCHIGSQLTELKPFLDATDRLIILMEQLKKNGINLHHWNLGGGLGVTYHDENAPHPAECHKKLSAKLKNYKNLEIILEPRTIFTANAGILVTKTEHI